MKQPPEGVAVLEKSLLTFGGGSKTNSNLATPNHICNLKEHCRRCQAADDGRVMGIVARTRKTPAHSVLSAVYAGLLYKHLLGGATNFKSNFYTWARSL